MKKSVGFLLKHSVIGLMILMFVACGGEKYTDNKQTTTLDEIAAYVEGRSTKQPTVEDYQNTGFKGVNAQNIHQINALVIGIELSTPLVGPQTEDFIQEVITAYIQEQHALDTTPPNITLKGSANITLTVGDTYTEQGATAIDNVDGNVSVQISGNVDTNTAGTYTVTYTATDKAGNQATITRSVTVQAAQPADTQAPAITLNGSNNITLTVGDTYTEQGATATDNVDGNVSVQISGNVDTNTAGTYTVTYTATDKAGNQAKVLRNVHIIPLPDTTPPVITLKGDNPLKLDTTQLYLEPGATANDNIDGNITSKISITPALNGQLQAGSHTVTYSVKDKAGNEANIIRKVIVVLKTNQNPFIELLGDNPLLLNQGSDYVEPGYLGRDREDGNITNKIKIISNTVNSAVAGEYEVKYRLTDSGGITVEAVRKVQVVATQAGNHKPVITLIGSSPIKLKLHGIYNEQGARANDTEDGDISNKIQITSTVNVDKVGTYSVTYSVKDSQGAISRQQRTVIIENSIVGTISGTASGISLKHIGAGVGGAEFAIAIDPHDTNNIFFSGDMGMVYHTTDGGKHWSIAPVVRRIRSIKIDPNNTNIIWAVGDRGAFKSTDGGKHWYHTLNLANNYSPTLGAVAIDPSDSNIVYIAEGFNPYLSIDWVRGYVWKTIDGGVHWRRLSRPGGTFAADTKVERNYTTLIVDPNNHQRVYVAGRDGIYRSTNGGDSWRKLTFFDEGQGSNMILVNQNGKSILFATVIPVAGHNKQGVYRSDNNAETWSPVNNGLNDIIDRLARVNGNINPSLKKERLLTLLLTSSKGRLYVGSRYGIAYSDDLGAHWVQNTPRESGQYLHHVDGQSFEGPTPDRISKFPHSYLGGLDNFLNIKAAPGNKNVVAFTDNQDLTLSTDGGNTWNSITFDYIDLYDDPSELFPADIAKFGSLPPNRYTHTIKSRGVQGIVNTDVAVDPFDSKIIYATYMDVGLQISRDNGTTWEHPSRGIPPRGHAWSVVVNPAVQGEVWASVREKGGIYFSQDNGRTWLDRSVDTTAGKVTDLRYDNINNILYAGTEKGGLYRSINKGIKWQKVLNKPVFDVKYDTTNPNIVYAGTLNGLYKSTDSGKNWRALETNTIGKVLHISLSKQGRVYVVSKEIGHPDYWGKVKVWRSVDGAKTFSDITPTFMDYTGAIAANPNNPDYIYIANFMTKDGSNRAQKVVMARSKNGGQTWEVLDENFAYSLGSDIYIDPNNTKRIFFNTRFSLIEALDTEAP